MRAFLSSSSLTKRNSIERGALGTLWLWDVLLSFLLHQAATARGAVSLVAFEVPRPSHATPPPVFAAADEQATLQQSCRGGYPQQQQQRRSAESQLFSLFTATLLSFIFSANLHLQQQQRCSSPEKTPASCCGLPVLLLASPSRMAAAAVAAVLQTNAEQHQQQQPRGRAQEHKPSRAERHKRLGSLLLQQEVFQKQQASQQQQQQVQHDVYAYFAQQAVYEEQKYFGGTNGEEMHAERGGSLSLYEPFDGEKSTTQKQNHIQRPQPLPPVLLLSTCRGEHFGVRCVAKLYEVLTVLLSREVNAVLKCWSGFASCCLKKRSVAGVVVQEEAEEAEVATETQEMSGDSGGAESLVEAKRENKRKRQAAERIETAFSACDGGEDRRAAARVLGWTASHVAERWEGSMERKTEERWKGFTSEEEDQFSTQSGDTSSFFSSFEGLHFLLYHTLQAAAGAACREGPSETTLSQQHGARRHQTSAAAAGAGVKKTLNRRSRAFCFPAVAASEDERKGNLSGGNPVAQKEKKQQARRRVLLTAELSKKARFIEEVARERVLSPWHGSNRKDPTRTLNSEQQPETEEESEEEKEGEGRKRHLSEKRESRRRHKGKRECTADNVEAGDVFEEEEEEGGSVDLKTRKAGDRGKGRFAAAFEAAAVAETLRNSLEQLTAAAGMKWLMRSHNCIRCSSVTAHATETGQKKSKQSEIVAAEGVARRTMHVELEEEAAAREETAAAREETATAGTAAESQGQYWRDTVQLAGAAAAGQALAAALLTLGLYPYLLATHLNFLRADDTSLEEEQEERDHQQASRVQKEEEEEEEKEEKYGSRNGKQHLAAADMEGQTESITEEEEEENALKVNINEDELSTFDEVLRQLIFQGHIAADLLRQLLDLNDKASTTNQTGEQQQQRRQQRRRLKRQQGGRGVEVVGDVFEGDVGKKRGMNSEEEEEVEEEEERGQVDRCNSEEEAVGRSCKTLKEKPAVAREGRHEPKREEREQKENTYDKFNSLFAETAASALQLLFVETDSVSGGFLRSVGKALWKVFCCFASGNSLKLLLEITAAKSSAPTRQPTLLLLNNTAGSSINTSSSSSAGEDPSRGSDFHSDSSSGLSEKSSSSSDSSEGTNEDELDEDVTDATAAPKAVLGEEIYKKLPKQKKEKEALQVGTPKAKNAVKTNSSKKDEEQRQQQQKMQQQQKTQQRRPGDDEVGAEGAAEEEEESVASEKCAASEDRLSVELDLECTYRALLDDDGEVLPDAYSVPVRTSGRRISQRRRLRKEKLQQMELRLRAATALEVYMCAVPRFDASLYLLATLCDVYVRAAAHADGKLSDTRLTTQWKQFTQRLQRIILDACAQATATLKKSKCTSAVEGSASGSSIAVAAESKVTATLPALCTSTHKSHIEGALTGRIGAGESQDQRLINLFNVAKGSNIVSLWCSLLAWKRQFCGGDSSQQDGNVNHVCTRLSATGAAGGTEVIQRYKPSSLIQFTTENQRSHRCTDTLACLHAVVALTNLPPLILLNNSMVDHVSGLERISGKVRVAGYDGRNCRRTCTLKCCGRSSGDKECSESNSISDGQDKRKSTVIAGDKSNCLRLVKKTGAKKGGTFKSDLTGREEERGRHDTLSEIATQRDETVVAYLHECWCAAELCLGRRAAEVIEICRRSRQLQQKVTASTCQQTCLTLLLHLFRVEQQTAAFYQALATLWCTDLASEHACSFVREKQRDWRPSTKQAADTRKSQTRQNEETDQRPFILRQERSVAFGQVGGRSAGEQRILTWPGSAATQLLTAGLIGWAHRARSSKQQHLDGLFFRTVAEKRPELLQWVDILGAAMLAERFFVKRECLALAAIVARKQRHCLISLFPDPELVSTCSLDVPESSTHRKHPSGVLSTGETNEKRGTAAAAERCPLAKNFPVDAMRLEVAGQSKERDQPGYSAASLAVRRENFFPTVVLDVTFLPWGRSGAQSWKTVSNRGGQQMEQQNNDADAVHAKGETVEGLPRSEEPARDKSTWCKKKVKKVDATHRKGEQSHCKEHSELMKTIAYREQGELEDTNENLSQQQQPMQKAATKGRSAGERYVEHNHADTRRGEKHAPLQRMLQQLTQMIISTMETESARRNDQTHCPPSSAAQRKALQKELLNTLSVVVQALVGSPSKHKKSQAKQQQQESGQRQNRTFEVVVQGNEKERSKLFTQQHQAFNTAIPAALGVVPVGTIQAAHAAVAMVQSSSTVRRLQDAAGRVLQLLAKLMV